MRPSTIVDYDREPWIMDEGTVRITFGHDVRAAVGSYDIFDSPLPTLDCAGTGKTGYGSEITEMLPQIVRNLASTECSRIYSSFKICTVL